nr:hypothetical protein CFP56_11591 [Quercus suber]
MTLLQALWLLVLAKSLAPWTVSDPSLYDCLSSQDCCILNLHLDEVCDWRRWTTAPTGSNRNVYQKIGGALAQGEPASGENCVLHQRLILLAVTMLAYFSTDYGRTVSLEALSQHLYPCYGMQIQHFGNHSKFPWTKFMPGLRHCRSKHGAMIT